MGTNEVIQHISNVPINPFAWQEALWALWFVIGIGVLWLDLTRKIHLGFLSIAAFMTVFASFIMPFSSQMLVFGFFGAAFTAAEHAHRQHQERTKHVFVHWSVASGAADIYHMIILYPLQFVDFCRVVLKCTVFKTPSLKGRQIWWKDALLYW